MSTQLNTRTNAEVTDGWSTQESARLYRTASWGDAYFSVSAAGSVEVHSHNELGTTMDLAAIVDELHQRGVQFPVSIRFRDILRAQVKRLNEAFAAAIDEVGYQSSYCAVYPMKVNQQHEVVDELIDAGRPFKMGLECGSKAELIAALPRIQGQTLLICNGVKDRTMLSLMISAQQLGQNVVPVIEKYAEFIDLKKLGFNKGHVPKIGVRVKLAAHHCGRWSESSGAHSKFGLSVSELLSIVRELEASGVTDRLELLHCHVGSQISDIQVLQQAANEVARVYVELVSRGLRIKYLDLDGGLGVNYDKNHVQEETSINYSLQEYANAIVCTVKAVCDAHTVPVPILITESGRALTAHHSVLIVPVMGAQAKDNPEQQLPVSSEEPEQIQSLARNLDGLPALSSTGELLAAYHDASERLDEVRSLFALGHLDLEQRALAEHLYWRMCTRLLAELERKPVVSAAERALLEGQLTDQYLGDFSVFQSMLDHWAIGQAFPIMPINRLHERPTRRGVLVDLTCDSDGKVSHYVSNYPDKRFLHLHELDPERPYYLGVFLMGAYEDIVGDAHNLFGRVSQAHVYADADKDGGFGIEKITAGTSIQDMLTQLQYFPDDLRRRMSELVRAKIESGAAHPTQGIEILDQYTACFPQNTYCNPRELE